MAPIVAPGLVVRKRADRSAGAPDPVTGSWPFAGLEIIGDPPPFATVSTGFVDDGVSQGWLTVEDAKIVVRPGGEPGNEMRRDKLHIFTHGSALVFHTVAGDVRYKIIHLPDKYVADGDDDTPMTDEHYVAGNSRVDNVYRLELEG